VIPQRNAGHRIKGALISLVLSTLGVGANDFSVAHAHGVQPWGPDGSSRDASPAIAAITNRPADAAQRARASTPPPPPLLVLVLVLVPVLVLLVVLALLLAAGLSGSRGHLHRPGISLRRDVVRRIV
jgi:hypothetical protein